MIAITTTTIIIISMIMIMIISNMGMIMISADHEPHTPALPSLQLLLEPHPPSGPQLAAALKYIFIHWNKYIWILWEKYIYIYIFFHFLPATAGGHTGNKYFDRWKQIHLNLGTKIFGFIKTNIFWIFERNIFNRVEWYDFINLT